jgi:hypothetical protein
VNLPSVANLCFGEQWYYISYLAHIPSSGDREADDTLSEYPIMTGSRVPHKFSQQTAEIAFSPLPAILLQHIPQMINKSSDKVLVPQPST